VITVTLQTSFYLLVHERKQSIGSWLVVWVLCIGIEMTTNS